MKKYLSLVCITALILITGRLGYQALFAYLAEHTYYFGILSSGQNRWIFISALICSLLPIGYLLVSSKVNLKNLIICFVVGAGIYGLIHSNIKGDPIGFGHVITIFNTVLLVALGIYLILGFFALGSWIERKLIKFKQIRWQEILLIFGIGFISFVIIVEILLGIGLLYGIVSWILFLGLGFMIRYERKSLSAGGEIIGNILDNLRIGLLSGKWDFKEKWNSNKFLYIGFLLLAVFSLSYLYIGIQNSFTPYSTAWDANHAYMYLPKILAENAGVYWGNTHTNTMPGLWEQFIAFVFSLTGCTNGWLGLSPDNIAISMNNISAFLALIFGIAVIFQIFVLITDKKAKIEEEKSELKKGKNAIAEVKVKNGNGLLMGWSILLLWLTSGMGAFLVIVDNKTDLGVMSICLLALLAGLIFIQEKKLGNKKEILKYLIITGLLFGFAGLAKITSFIDFMLFGLLLLGLRFSSLTSLGLGMIVMGLVRKFNVLTAFVVLDDSTATGFIIAGGIITIIGFVISLLNKEKRKKLGRNILNLLLLGICFLAPLLIFKLPRVVIGQIKTDSFSVKESLVATFLRMVSAEEGTGLGGSSDNTDSDKSHDDIPNDQTFNQCSSVGNVYSTNELYGNLKELYGGGGGEDLGRYIGYGWKEFNKNNIFTYNGQGTGDKAVARFFMSLWPKSNECEGLTDTGDDDENLIICEKNLMFGLMKVLWPTNESCYGFDHDAKVLCNNSGAIDNFKIDDLRAIYENGINDKDGEAGKLLKQAIDAYDKAKSAGEIRFGVSYDAIFHDEIVNLRQYYQSNSIYSSSGSIYIPYTYLVPLNISFNWSLQNLSSYYTDIGFIWITIFVLLFAALVYAIVKRDNILASLTLTTFVGWGVWWIIGSSILWYGIASVVFSMITLAVFWGRLLEKNNKEEPKFLPWILIILVGIIFGIQILFNFLRISSQGANSVFVRYKGNIGSQQIIDDFSDEGKPVLVTKKIYGYGWKDIFDLQFPQYNPIINALADRNDDDGVLIAGTYIQYFLGNQWNLKIDGMLNNFWRNLSDGNLCKTYWRMKNDKIHYLVIDPNIGTVTMGEGNETLFYRFFGKLNNTKSGIEMDGTITTLIKLYKAGYLKLLSTNNLGAKYAFSVEDDILNSVFGGNLTEEQLILARSKMTVLQYFEDANSLFSSIANIFLNRVMNDPKLGIEDIANVYGLEIDSDKVANVAISYINKISKGESVKGIAKDLTQDERTVLLSYLSVRGDNSQVQNLLLNSVTGGSQVIALELN